MLADVVADVGKGVGVLDTGVGVEALPGVGVGAEVSGVGVGAGADELLKTTLGLWLLGSVTVNELVVSCTVNATVPAAAEVTVKLPCPF